MFFKLVIYRLFSLKLVITIFFVASACDFAPEKSLEQPKPTPGEVAYELIRYNGERASTCTEGRLEKITHDRDSLINGFNQIASLRFPEAPQNLEITKDQAKKMVSDFFWLSQELLSLLDDQAVLQRLVRFKNKLTGEGGGEIEKFFNRVRSEPEVLDFILSLAEFAKNHQSALAGWLLEKGESWFVSFCFKGMTKTACWQSLKLAGFDSEISWGMIEAVSKLVDLGLYDDIVYFRTLLKDNFLVLPAVDIGSSFSPNVDDLKQYLEALSPAMAIAETFFALYSMSPENHCSVKNFSEWTEDDFREHLGYLGAFVNKGKTNLPQMFQLIENVMDAQPAKESL